MERIKAAVVGLGFIGTRHLDTLMRLPQVEVVAVADADAAVAEGTAKRFGVPHVFTHAGEVFSVPGLQVLHNCTPNALHFPLNRQAIEAGIHIYCEKPLAVSPDESRQLLELSRSHPQVCLGVNFNYRMNTMVREARRLVGSGAIGTPRLASGGFLQDWLLFESDYNWRLNAAEGGKSRAVADIGSHWMDLVQYVTGSRITRLCADLSTVVPVRRRTLARTETFSAPGQGAYEEVPIDTEDYAAVLFHTQSGLHGSYTVSQVSAGHKCDLFLEVSGSTGSLRWEQETPNKLWIGRRDAPNADFNRDPALLDPAGGGVLNLLPGGHPEGWNDALLAGIHSFYNAVADPLAPREFANFQDGHRLLLLTDAVLESARKQAWVELPLDE